jgi:hypothetical protein
VTKYLLEIFDATNTTKQAVVPGYALMSGSFVRELNGEDYIEFTVNRRELIWSELDHRLIVRLVDISTVPTTYRSFRVISLREERTSDNKVVGFVRAEHIKYDLSTQIHNAAEEIIEQTPVTHLTKILTGSGFTVGTVTPTDRVSIVYSYNTRLFDLEQVRQKTDYDLVINENKSVDLEVQGSSTGASIRFRRNLSSIRRTVDRLQANIMYGLGGEGNTKQVMTIADATHRITNIAGTVLTLDSRKIVSSNDSLNGFYVQKPDNTFTLINDSIKQTSGNDQLDVASVVDLAVGNPIKIRTAASAVSRLEYVPDAASRTAYGDVEGVYRNESIPEIFNLVGPFASSALSGTYTSGLCEGWSEIGDPVTTENTNVAFIKNGTKSQKVVVAAIAAPSNAPSAATSGFGILTGTYKYKKTWRSSEGETTASPESGTVTPIAQTIDVGRNESSPSSHVVSWRIYRTKSGGSTFYFVADIPVGTSTYTDNTMDTDLTIVEPASNVAAGGQGVGRSFAAFPEKEYAAVVWVFVEANSKVRVELETGTTFFPDPNIESVKRSIPVRSQDTMWIVTIQGLIANGVLGQVRILSHENGSTSTFYVDAAMVVENAYAPGEGVFIADNSATTLWYETYDALQEAKDPKLTYDVDGLDLFEYDRAGYSGDQITPGDTIKVVDEELGINESLRCTKKNSDILEPWKTRFEISNAPKRITEEVENLKMRDLANARTVANRAIRIAQQFSLERATASAPVIEFAELEA